MKSQKNVEDFLKINKSLTPLERKNLAVDIFKISSEFAKTTNAFPDQIVLKILSKVHTLICMI